MKEYEYKEHKIKVVIETKAYEDLLKYSLKNEKRETGGILIGYYDVSLKKAIITEVTKEPADSKAGFSWFFRGIKGIKEVIIKRWEEKEEYYLGEWHFHPQNSPAPSSTDINQIKKISKDKRYNCKEPILIIIGGNRLEYDISVTLLFKNKLILCQEKVQTKMRN